MRSINWHVQSESNNDCCPVDVFGFRKQIAFLISLQFPHTFVIVRAKASLSMPCSQPTGLCQNMYSLCHREALYLWVVSKESVLVVNLGQLPDVHWHKYSALGSKLLPFGVGLDSGIRGHPCYLISLVLRASE
jgi:hypothetical protein